MILPDNPIINNSQDKLRRTPLALKVSELIKNFKEESSFVIGIEGAWGAGKSSFVNLVINDLKESEDIIVMTFNPWNFTGQNELLSEFFSSLSTILGGKLDKRDIKTLRSYASKLQVSFSPSIPIPFLGSIGLGEIWKKGVTTLKEDREKIDNKLKSLNKRIVIVIDDIDRLDKKETRLIMKLVKMTANFVNTVFLLAYDRERVCERLNEDGWPGDEYLKKIIQVSFTLPEADRQQLLQILFSDLDETIKGVYGEVRLEGENEKRWGEMLYKGFRDLFKTIRDIKRFISSLRLNWSIIGKNEVNQVDFMGIEAIRVFAPKFYSAIAANKSLFTDTSNSHSGYYGDNKALKQTKHKELTELIPKDYEDIIKGITEVLFPQIGDMNYGSEWQSEWRKEQRICSEERFNFYFQLGIPNGEVSEIEVRTLIDSLKTPQEFSENILRLKKEEKLRKTFPKLIDKLDVLDEQGIKDAIVSLWNLEKELSEEREEIFDYDDPTTWIGRLSHQSFKKILAEKRISIAKEIIEKSKTLYYPLRFVSLEEDVIREREYDKNFTKEELDTLKPLIVKRINEFAADERLLKESSFVRILFLWAQWENKEKVKEYIHNLLAKYGVAKVLKLFVYKVLSTGGNYNEINKKTVGEMYPIEEIETLVQAMSEKDIKKMDEKEKEAVNLFKNPKKNGFD